MGDKRRFDNSIGICASTTGKPLPDGRKLQEGAWYAHQQEASVFYGAECHFDLVELHRVLNEILYGQDEQEKPSLFSEYSVNLDELSDSSATSPYESSV